ALYDALDDPAAFAARTGLALAIVHLETMLEIAERAVGLDVVVERRAAGLDRLGDDLAQCRCQPLGARRDLAGLRGDRSGRPPGRQLCPPQCLAGIDVADAGD